MREVRALDASPKLARELYHAKSHAYPRQLCTWIDLHFGLTELLHRPD
jgi:hypothetical protein